LPIQGEGVHTLPRGSENAMRELERLLRVNPEDLRSRWLLNIAAMTLGKYPDGVPSEWLIDPAVFESDEEMAPFPDVAPAIGLGYSNLAGGGATEDLDGDGDLDLVTSSMGVDDPMAVFLNRGDGTFENATAASGLSGITGGLNLITADYDNDGDVDVFVLRGAWMLEQGLYPNSLLRNNGDATFEDVTSDAGLLSFHPTQTGVWADFNNDGHIDLYVGNESVAGGPPHPNELYRNNGDGTFTNVAAATGTDLVGYVKGVIAGDYDNDGDQDIYVSVLGEANRLFRNDFQPPDKDPRFTEVGAAAGVTEPMASFPTWFVDYDNDGFLDLFVSGYGINNPDGVVQGSTGPVAASLMGLPTSGERPRLYHNNGDGTFRDVTAESGLWEVLLTMGANYGDLDNDGW
jgi:hypothetical protein